MDTYTYTCVIAESLIVHPIQVPRPRTHSLTQSLLPNRGNYLLQRRDMAGLITYVRTHKIS